MLWHLIWHPMNAHSTNFYVRQLGKDHIMSIPACWSCGCHGNRKAKALVLLSAWQQDILSWLPVQSLPRNGPLIRVFHWRILEQVNKWMRLISLEWRSTIHKYANPRSGVVFLKKVSSLLAYIKKAEICVFLLISMSFMHRGLRYPALEVDNSCCRNILRMDKRK